jgi:hypothetical protein
VKVKVTAGSVRAATVNAAKDRAQAAQSEVLELLRERLQKMRLRVPRRPKDIDGNPLDPQMPADITMLNDEQLGRLHGEFAAMVSYVYGQLGLRAVEHSISKRADKLMRAQVRLGKSGTVEDKAASTETDSRTRAVSELLLVAEATERLTQAIHDGYLVGRDLCSRDMTRRMSTNNQRG